MEAWRRATARWSPVQLRDGGRRGETLDGLAPKFWLAASRACLRRASRRRRRENHQGKDRARVRGGTPVAALSRAPDDWMHAPFDVAELAHNFGDGVDALGK